MEEHLSQIRAAIAAPFESSKQAALLACQALRAALEGLPSLEATPAAGTQPSPPPEEPQQQQEPAPELYDTSEVPLSRETLEAATPRGEPPSVGPAEFSQTVPGVDPAAIAALVSTLRSLTPDQWLDLLISKLRGAVGTSEAQRLTPKATAPAGPVQPSPIRFQLVPIPSSRPLGTKPSR